MNSAPITTSLFSLFKVGPGPSSSHTMAPMQAAYRFRLACLALAEDILLHVHSIEAYLYGSLSATGAGHGTDDAVLSGLVGNAPEECLETPYVIARKCESISLGAVAVPRERIHIVHASVHHDFPYSNTIVFKLNNQDGVCLFEQEYYSVGGGFILCKGENEPETGMPEHPYSCMTELHEIVRSKALNLYEIMLDNEVAITGRSRSEIINRLTDIIEFMDESVKRGLSASGRLPGTLGVQRKAESLWERAKHLPEGADRFLARLSACAFAAAEENANGGRIVTAPTCGSAGVMPALVYIMRHELCIGDRAIREGFLAAAAVGFIAKHNASISGAEVGCQGEIGVASAMAAAMLTDARGNSFRYTENAAEIALEHHLGLTCDPVGGYVQIPCIERNAMGALKAYTASIIATGTNPFSQKVSLDAAIAAMAETGREMNQKFKETALGGLAVSMVVC